MNGRLPLQPPGPRRRAAAAADSIAGGADTKHSMFSIRRQKKLVIRPRAEHGISRRDIDPDALRVLYRLSRAGHTAFLVGGSVRDLLLGRRPKDLFKDERRV